MKWIRSRGVGNSRPRFFFVLIITVMLALSLSAAAQNQYYVSTSGSDSNNGASPSTPWRHISKAIASFTLGPNGAQINVHAGMYSDENITCNSTNSAVCINRGGTSSTALLKLVCDTQWSVPSGSGCILRNSAGEGGIGVIVNNVEVGAINQFGFDISNSNHYYGLYVPCIGLPHISTGTCQSGNNVHLLGNYLHDLSQTLPCEVNPNGHPASLLQQQSWCEDGRRTDYRQPDN